MAWVLIIAVFLIGYVAGAATMFIYVAEKLGPVAVKMEQELKAIERVRKASGYWSDL